MGFACNNQAALVSRHSLAASHTRKRPFPAPTQAIDSVRRPRCGRKDTAWTSFWVRLKRFLDSSAVPRPSAEHWMGFYDSVYAGEEVGAAGLERTR